MKRFLHAGEGYALFQESSLQTTLHQTDKTFTDNIRLYSSTTQERYGSLVRPWFRQAAGLMPVALVCFMAGMGSTISRLMTGISSTFSRSPLEAESKPSRRIVEAESNNCRRTVEQVSNKPRRNTVSCNLFSIRTSCIYLGLFFMCLQAAIAKEPAPETDRAVLVANSHLNTSQQEIPRISVGQRLPEEFWTTPFTFYDHEKVYTKTLEEYRGRTVILSFWSSTCTICINAFPNLNRINADHPESIRIIPVNAYDRDSIPVIDRRFSKLDDSYHIAGIIHDRYIKELFPHGPVPHYIWINARGRVSAITTGTLINEENILKIVRLYEAQ